MINKIQRLEIWKQLKKKRGNEYIFKDLVDHFLTIVLEKDKILYFGLYGNSEVPPNAPLPGMLQTTLVQDV